jgi:hypothetical protein
MRTVKLRVMEIGLAARQKGPQGEQRKKAASRRLLSATRKIANQAERVINEIAHSRGKVKQLGQQLGEAIIRVGHRPLRATQLSGASRSSAPPL